MSCLIPARQARGGREFRLMAGGLDAAREGHSPTSRRDADFA
jgi:hypothetical protein